MVVVVVSLVLTTEFRIRDAVVLQILATMGLISFWIEFKLGYNHI
jgi:hypothetical protein